MLPIRLLVAGKIGSASSGEAWNNICSPIGLGSAEGPKIMATFLYTAVSPGGVTITQRSEASTAEEVRLLLEAKGFSQIVFHTDDYSAKLDEKLFAETGGKRRETCVSPEEQKAIRFGSGVPQTIFRSCSA